MISSNSKMSEGNQPIKSHSGFDSFNISKLRCGRWLNLVMCAAFYLQFVLIFTPLYSYSMQSKGESRQYYYATVATVTSSPVLVIFSALFLLLAFAAYFVYFLKDYTKIRFSFLDVFFDTFKREFATVPAVVTVIYNYVILMVSKREFMRELGVDSRVIRQAKEQGISLYCGLSFGGVVFLILTFLALLLILFQLYDLFSKKATAAPAGKHATGISAE